MAVARLTVVMITKDRRNSAVHAVRMLRAMPDDVPVIVVDNASTDGTAEALAGLGALGGVTVIRAATNLGSAGRTVGVEAAASPYVAFADDDSWWAPGALRCTADLFDRHPRLGLLAARTRVGPDERDDPINAELAAAPFGHEPDLPGPTVLGFLACAAAVRRAAYLEVGGFHPRLGVGGEEQLLALDLAAAGWGLSYVPDVVAHHHPASGPTREGRTVRQRRNDLWTAWLRAPLSTALGKTARLGRQALRDPESRAVLRASAAGLPWVLRERRTPSLTASPSPWPSPWPGSRLRPRSAHFRRQIVRATRAK